MTRLRGSPAQHRRARIRGGEGLVRRDAGVAEDEGRAGERERHRRKHEGLDLRRERAERDADAAGDRKHVEDHAEDHDQPEAGHELR
ncbi:MAG: hypothetical protein U0S48_06600 [Solirubrobacteraceae bacterium]